MGEIGRGAAISQQPSPSSAQLYAEPDGGDSSMIEFGQDICTDVNSACSREWLETNGLGGFASSTIIGLNTRRYHGLLTAAIKPPLGRVLLLSKLEDSLILNGQHFELSANQYPGVIHPRAINT